MTDSSAATAEVQALTSGEIIDLFADELPERILEELRDLELSPELAITLVYGELLELKLDADALFEERGIAQ